MAGASTCKNLLHNPATRRKIFGAIAADTRMSGNSGAPCQKPAPPWISNLAQRLMHENARLVLASPFVFNTVQLYVARQEYSRNIIDLHRAMGCADRLFFTYSNERGETARMFQEKPPFCPVLIIGDRIDAGQLFRIPGAKKPGIFYPEGITASAMEFAARHSSFFIAGTFPAVNLVKNAIAEYLAITNNPRPKPAPSGAGKGSLSFAQHFLIPSASPRL